MAELNRISKSRPLQIAWFFTNLLYWLGWLAAAMLFFLIIIMWTTDFEVKYARLPVQVEYAENSRGDIENSITSPRSIPVAGFNYLKVRADRLPGLNSMMLMPAVLLAGFIWILFLLRRFLRNVRKGSPFAPDNPCHLKTIGWLVTIGGPVFGLFEFIYAKAYINLVDLPGATLTPVTDVHPFVIIAGLIIVVVASVYDAAVKIKSEADLTI